MKKFLSMALLCGIILCGSFSAMAASKSLDGGRAAWRGGISRGVVYSNIQDQRYDNIRYRATVWVRNDMNRASYKTGTTTGFGAGGRIEVTTKATYINPFRPNKSGYKDFARKR